MGVRLTMPLKAFMQAGLIAMGTGLTAAFVFLWKGRPVVAIMVAVAWFVVLKMLTWLVRKKKEIT
jgi:hypothetical protein